MIILAPEQTKPALPPAPIKPAIVADHFDRLLIEAISQPDDEPVPLWPMVHAIVEGERPVDRTARRRLVGRLLSRVRCLLRRRVLVRDGKGCVRLSDPLPAPPATSSPTALPTPASVKNWPPSPHPSVTDLGSRANGGSRGRVYRV